MIVGWIPGGRWIVGLLHFLFYVWTQGTCGGAGKVGKDEANVVW